MFARSRTNAPAIDWGNGLSYRLLVAKDNMGFALAHTVVKAGTESKLQYRDHLEACYCISGSGAVISADGTTTLQITPGTVYALDLHDAHVLKADAKTDLELISVFNPPIRGDEKHDLSDEGYSHY